MTTEDKPTNRGSPILAFTVSHGDRRFLKTTVPTMRGAAGQWFDWAVWLGNCSIEAQGDALALLHDPRRLGIQHLYTLDANIGQHHATKAAIALARQYGYTWLLRIDDDMGAKTARWLKKLIDQSEDLRQRAKDKKRRLVVAPKIVGLQNPLRPSGELNVGQQFKAEIMEVLGGGCRLHPVELLENYEPPLYAPLGRGDPQHLADYVLSDEVQGMLVRLPSIRVVHRTRALEKDESDAQKLQRRMGRVWCYLGAGE